MISRGKFKYLKTLYRTYKIQLTWPYSNVIPVGNYICHVPVFDECGNPVTVVPDVDVIEPTEEQRTYNRKLLQSYLFHKA